MKLQDKPIPRHTHGCGFATAGTDPGRPLQAHLAERIPPSRPEALYVHTPFCFHKCHYCDFYSIVDTQNRQEAFVDRLIVDIRTLSTFKTGPMGTVFVGGGTPTLLETGLWARLLDDLADWIEPDGGTEFTVEANPETVTSELVRTLAAGGVNRVSIGAQSFNKTHLQTLERWHEIENVGRAVDLFRIGGITNINLDLIFGIPGQTVDQWRGDLERAIALEPMHLSCYGLTYEPGTAMTARLEAGLLEPADADVEADMFEATREVLGAAGFNAYEVSNFARPGFECRHNLVYWRGQNYLAAGPSAAGHVADLRWKNAAHLGDYLASDHWPPVSEIEILDAPTMLAERLMLGLRLMEGIEACSLESQTRAIDEETHARLATALLDARARGEITKRSGRWVLTPYGLLMGDRVAGELMAAVRGEGRTHGSQ